MDRTPPEHIVKDCDKHITRDCPFCTETESIGIVESFGTGVNNCMKSYYVKCYSCRAKGPRHSTPLGACKDWSEGVE